MITRESTVPAWRPTLAAAGLGRLADLLETEDPRGLAGRWEVLSKPGLAGRQRSRWMLDGGNGERVLYVKRYTSPPLALQMDRLRRQTVLHSRAWWEFRQAERLTAAHIPVAQPVGYVEQMRGAFEHRSVVLLEPAVGDAFDRVWMRLCQHGAPITRGRARHDVAERLGRLAAAFHQTGYCHRDLYLCHIFVELDPEARRPPRFALIDLARTHRPRWRRMRWIIKDLAQLDCSARQIGATRADRLRGLLAYLGLQPGAQRLRWYVRRIVRKSDQILRRIERESRRA